ncbi:MAG TPA: sterol desaturase family protein, partial [Salinimicrobium sp.]|nr:sterol desaturase family protein [Salinimicrobium sp.]
NMVAIFIGHLNHANIAWDYGPFKYIFNNPKMHIWHHSREVPDRHKNRNGVNFGLTLSIWDYLFGTAYLPQENKKIEIGLAEEKDFPQDFWGQVKFPFRK